MLDWGLALILRLQSLGGPALDPLMRGFSFLGDEAFFVLLFPFLYWCLDSRLGLRLALVYGLSGFLNQALKSALAQPRPADLAPGIARIAQPGYGLPSGHAQGAVVLWGLLAWESRRRWSWIPAALLVLAVGLSRVYLGVHFPTDVLAGWAAGAAVLGAAVLVLRRARQPAPDRAAPGWFWIPAAALAAAAALWVLQDDNTVAMVAALWGFVVGHILRQRLLPGGEEGTLTQRLLRLPAGLAVLLGLYLGLKALFPAEGQPLYLPLRFARYALAGLWAALGAPALFRWVGLAHPRN